MLRFKVTWANAIWIAFCLGIFNLSVFACNVDFIINETYEPEEIAGGFPVSIERGTIKSDGSEDAKMSNYEQWIRSAYFIETDGVESVRIPINHKGQCYLWQYDVDYRMISRNEMDAAVLLDSKCKYIRFSIRASNTPEHVYILFSDEGKEPRETKRMQIGTPYERLVYAVNDDVYTTAILMLPPNYTIDGDSVPLIVWDSGDGSFRDWDGYECATYAGRANGVRFLRDSGFAVLEIYSWGSKYYKKYPGCGGRSAMPIPTHLATHEKGIEYVLDRYNIDPDNIFHVSKSGSGKMALYYALVKPSFNLKSIYAFAPVFDDLTFVGWGMQGYRQALFEELDLQGTKEEVDFFLYGEPYDYDVEYKQTHNLSVTLNRSWQMHKPLGRSFIAQNAEKFKTISVDWMNMPGQTIEELMDCTHHFSEMFWDGYNRHYEDGRFFFEWDDYSLPAAHSEAYNRYDLVRTGSHIPFTVIMSPTDEQTPYWNALEVVKQLQNGGEDAQMITLERGGHSGPDLSTGGTNVVSDVTTHLGIHYDMVSIGWYLAVEDIYKRFLSTSTENN